MKKISKFIGLVLLFSNLSCVDDNQGPLEQSGSVPQKVTVLSVENMPGAAKIFYSLPDDPNVLYVQADYTLSNGEKKSVKASTYTNFIAIEGFGKSEMQDVKLFTVTRSEVSSEPVEVEINPLPARIHEVFQTLAVSETFGGVFTHFQNTSKAELILHTLIKSDDGTWAGYDRLYSNAAERAYSIRGLENEPIEFAFYFSDKWNNSSDTLIRILTPLFETVLDKALWRNAKLFNDTYRPEFAGWDLENAWDNTTGKFYWGHPSQPENLAIPNWFTIDLGKKYIFSRIRVNQISHHNSFMYSMGAPQVFEIWGSNNPSQDGDWNNWTQVGSYESKKPSGSAMGFLTDEDIRVALAGEDFDFPVNLAPYRYIRFKTNRTYGGTLNVALSELTLWGQQID